MAYTVTQKFKDIIYSGDNRNTAKLSIGGTIIPTSNIKSIKASNPIIDKDKMCLGTFISNQLEITFRNMDNVPLTGDVYLEIGVKVDNAYEYVPIGYFIIDDLKEDYYTTCKITCLDRAVKMKTNVDISKQVPISAKNLLIWLCQKYNIVLGTYPLINNDVITNMYDSSYSGKKYVSMIAEIMGGFAKFGRDGKLYIIPLKRDSIATINAKKSKSFQKKELYKITRVVYEDAIRKFEYGTPTNNTLYISNDNFFITDTTVIQNIYNAVLNTEIWSLKTENYADISLDCWDYITYTIDNKNYITLNNNSYIYEQNIMSKVDVDIDIKSKQENTNKVVSNDKEQIRILKTEINQATGEIALLNKKVETVEVKIEKVKESWRGTEIPTLSNKPAVDWNTNLLKDNHLDEIYFCDNNGINYIFTKTISANITSYSWVEASDKRIAENKNDLDKTNANINSNYDSKDEAQKKLNDLKTAVTKETQTLMTQTNEDFKFNLYKDLKYDSTTGTITELQNTLVSITIDGIRVNVNSDSFNTLMNNIGVFIYDGTIQISKMDKNGIDTKNLFIENSINKFNTIIEKKVVQNGVTSVRGYWRG